MTNSLLFYAVFLSQIFIVFYYTRKFIKQISYVLDTYPPSTHPKLYPGPIDINVEETGRKKLRLYGYMNLFIVLVGFMIILAAALSGYDPHGKGEENIVTIYFMLQMVPLMLIEISGFKQYRLMREANIASTRKADLHPRRLFDFISPVIFSIAVFMLFAYALFNLYITDFHVELGSPIFIRLTGIACLHLLFTGLVLWHMYGKKLDPYQAHKDRMKQIEVIVKTSVFASIALSIFFLTTTAMKEFELEYLEPLLFSVFFQITAIFSIGTVLRTYQMKNLDFDVYKEDMPTGKKLP